MKILGEKTLLTYPVQSIAKKLIEIKNDIIFIFTILCGVSERFHLFEAAKRSVILCHFPLIPLGRQGLRLRFVELLTYTISVSLTTEIHKTNINTFRVINKQYYKIILF